MTQPRRSPIPSETAKRPQPTRRSGKRARDRATGPRFLERELEDFLRAWGEGKLAGGDKLALTDNPLHLRANLLDSDVEVLQHARGESLFLPKKAAKNVLGADVVVLEAARFVLGEDDDLAGSLREAFEHSGVRV
jgi:hypothetical protein